MPRDASSSVRAVVRVRPLLQQELEAGHENCCQASGDRSILVRVGAANQFRKYSFDACLPEDRSQKQVFQESGVTCLLDAAVAGYAATVLAYGQTGSGKTYTMMGRSSTGDRTSDCGDEVKRNDGLVIRAARRLFRQIGESTGGSRITVGASFAEIFNAPGAVNECICDLLNPDAGHLQVRFSQKHGFFISDLAVAECRTLADVRAVLEAGLQNRRVNAHALNRESSRTHALFTLHIDSEQAPLYRTVGAGRTGTCASYSDLDVSQTPISPVAEKEDAAVIGHPRNGKLRQNNDYSGLEDRRAKDGAGGCMPFRERFCPLHLAVLKGEVEMVKLLLASGADPTQRTSRGRTALQLAKPHARPVREAMEDLLSCQGRVYSVRQVLEMSTDTAGDSPTGAWFDRRSVHVAGHSLDGLEEGTQEQ
ncbi:Kif12 [Symbiodinium necroappetens]|uniref:Kif12 protein n=1 Tax=Symbiodinium necroappetens TaxID=1628268 RepID=A0A812UYH6_9DINO|nr:Kif12 [Symbiodinium necroappetens]